MLAHHYEAALEYAGSAGQDTVLLTDRARAAFREAGDRALALNAFPAAMRFYYRALDLSQPDDADRPELLFRLGRALHSAADDRAEQVLDDAARELVAAGRDERAAEAHGLLSQVWWTGETETFQGRARASSRAARARRVCGESQRARPPRPHALHSR